MKNSNDTIGNRTRDLNQLRHRRPPMEVSSEIYILADLPPGEELPLPIEWKDGMDIVAIRRISTYAGKQTPVVQRETCLTHRHDKFITRGRKSNIRNY